MLIFLDIFLNSCCDCHNSFRVTNHFFLMKVSSIFVYPIKSCQGISLIQTEVHQSGFIGNREFMLVDQQGRF